MTIDNRKYIQKKIFLRMYAESMDIIYSEVLDPEAGLPEEISQSIALEGIAEIEGQGLQAIEDGKQVNYAKKVLFQIVSKDIELPIELNESSGYLLYYNNEDISMKEPTIRVYAPQKTLDNIKSEFINNKTMIEIGVYIDLLVDETISQFDTDNMLDKLYMIDKTHKALLANVAVRRTVKSIETESIEEDNTETSFMELKEEIKDVHRILERQHATKTGILNHFTLLNFILIGWSATIIYMIISK